MFTINCRGKITGADKPLIMGILNITPDSFYEGFLHESVDSVVNKAGQMLEEGATILDIGGQSTRPNSERIDADMEWNRISAFLIKIREQFPHALISVDTYHSRVAGEAIQAGADMINDISFGDMDPAMIPLLARSGVPYIGMHMKGRPENMQNEAVYENLVTDILDYLIRKSEVCRQAGIKDLIIDPGFGFGKTIEQNFFLLKNLPAFCMLGKPLLVGLSRKSSIYKTLHITAQESLNGTTVMHTLALQNGANILRVHDVKEAMQTILLTEAYKKAAP